MRIRSRTSRSRAKSRAGSTSSTSSKPRHLKAGRCEAIRCKLRSTSFPSRSHCSRPPPKLPGTDGRKMSKSYGNSILLSDPEAEVRKKLKTMVTDPPASAAPIPAIPTSAPSATCTRSSARRKPWPRCAKAAPPPASDAFSARAGSPITSSPMLNPIQERRRKYEDNPKLAWDILEAGSARAASCRRRDSGRGARVHAHVC